MSWVTHLAWCKWAASLQRRSRGTKSWKGEGTGVFELVESFRGDTYRVAYTVRFAKAVYVLHCFQKKSPSGIRTAKTDIDLIHERLKTAHNDYRVRYGKED